MRHPRIIIASVSLAVAAAIGGGITAVAATTSHASSQPAASQPAAATVRTAHAAVAGKTETILVNSQGLPPLYYYLNDTAAASAVTGRLATLWPPLTSTSPAATGLTGNLAAVMDAHGDQVAYNGHLLYTFADDQACEVTGQGVQGFFVATPGLTPVTRSPGIAPAASSGNGYGY